MDLPLWNPPDDQGYLSSYQSGYYPEDSLLCEFSCSYGRDMMEEDALNEKSCLQVLKILMVKADEDIIKLEEDIMMLQCQLAWDDEEWSKQCSAALNQNIDHLDTLIQSLKKEITEDVHDLGLELEQPVKLPPRLHDLLKPLLENYFEKSKQIESSIKQMPVLPAAGFGKKKSEARTSKDEKKTEEKECTNMFKTNERNSQSMELKERKLNQRQDKKDAAISKFNAHGTDKLSENDINKPDRPQGRRTQNSALAISGRRSSIKSEPSDVMEKDTSARTSIKKANSREREESRDNDKEVIPKAKSTQHGPEHECKVTNSHESRETVTPISERIKVDCMKQTTAASRDVRKARVYRHAINKNVLSMLPSVKMKRKRRRFPETTEAFESQETEMKDSLGSFNDRTKHGMEPKKKMKLECEVQVQQRHETETLVISQAKSISSSKPEGQGPQKKRTSAQETVQNSMLSEHVDMGSSSTENLKGQQKYGVFERIRKYGKKETQQQLYRNNIDSASEITFTSSLSSETMREKKGLRKFLIKLAKMECDTSNSTTEEASDGKRDVPHNSSPCIKDVEILTLNDLKAIAKNQKLHGYSRLRKAELQKSLGLEPLYLRQKSYNKKGTSSANTI